MDDPQRLRPGTLAFVAVLALLVGTAIGYVDSRATWDDAGVTAGGLVLAGLVLGAVRCRHWWVSGLLVGVPVVVFNLVQYGRLGALIAIPFGLVGAGVGASLARALRQS